jgi:hypothetical protein
MTDRTRQLYVLAGAVGARDRTPLAAWGLLGQSLLASAALVLAAAGCAGSSSASSGAAPSSPGESAAHRSGGASTTATLVGARCKGGDGHCSCRRPGDNHAENPAPDADHKRFEIRIGNEDGGDAVLESPTLGRFTAGASETCFYIDVLPGTHHLLTFTSREGRPTAGLSPTMRIAEYGPKGPYWYDVVEVHCRGAVGRCTRDAAEEWGAEAKGRKRGRIDPCGSSVVTHLLWETSGGAGDRDSGLFRDLTVSFEMEVKKFATQFAPGSTECVPK